MNKRLSWIAAFAATTAVLTCAQHGLCGTDGPAKTADQGKVQEKPHAQAAIGKPAPDFALKGIDGKEHKLSDLKGNIVVLEWTNHKCPFVQRHQSKEKTMQKTAAKFAGKPVAWLAINSSYYCEQKLGEIKAWVKENGITYPLLLDAEGKVGRLYGAKTTPHMFVIDSKGVLAYSGAVDDDRFGDKGTKKNYVEDAVTALLNGSTVSTATTYPYGCAVKYKK